MGGAGGRPPLAGRQSPLNFTGRSSPLTAGTTGRNSPLLHKGMNKTGGSPVVRRVRKSSGIPKPSAQMRKSVSLTNIDSAEGNNDQAGKLVESCQQYLSENNQQCPIPELESLGQNEVRQIKIERVDAHEEDTQQNLNFNEIETQAEPAYLGSYETLPIRGSHSKKNISRLIVPKMRKMFEKARSCEPDLHRAKVMQSPPLSPEDRRSEITFDGTESARDSFLMLSPAAATQSLTGSAQTLSENSDGSGDHSNKSKGFVNKCVHKMKNFMGKSQERD